MLAVPALASALACVIAAHVCPGAPFIARCARASATVTTKDKQRVPRSHHGSGPLGRSLPVENQRDRRWIDRVSRSVEQEPLAVGRDDVLLPRHGSCCRPQFERGELACRERAFRSRRLSRGPLSIADRQQCRTVPTRFLPSALAGRRPQRPESDHRGRETAAGRFRNGPLHSIDTRPTCRRAKTGRRVLGTPSARMGEACGRHRATRTRGRPTGPWPECREERFRPATRSDG